MATSPTKPETKLGAGPNAASVPAWPSEHSQFESFLFHNPPSDQTREPRPSGGDALQALLAFSAMHQQVRRRRALASRLNGFETIETVAPAAEFETEERFVLNEVLQ